MRFEMVDGGEPAGVNRGNRLGGHQPDNHAADQARPGGCGDPAEIGEADARFLHNALDEVVEVIDMAARGKLGDDTAEGAVIVDLRQHGLGENAAVVGDERRGGFIATRFNSQDDHSGGMLSVDGGRPRL